MSGKVAANRRVLAIQAKKKRKNPKRKGGGGTSTTEGVVTRDRAAREQQQHNKSYEEVDILFYLQILFFIDLQSYLP